MGALHKIVKNYTLPLAAACLVLSVIGLVLGAHLLAMVDPALDMSVTTPLGIGPGSGWDLWVMFLGIMGFITGAWYVGEQLLARRKFERLLNTDKRSEFVGARKDLEELARKLPDGYKPRIAAKESEFKLSKRA